MFLYAEAMLCQALPYGYDVQKLRDYTAAVKIFLYFSAARLIIVYTGSIIYNIFSECISSALQKERLTPLPDSSLHIFRHIAQELFDIRRYVCKIPEEYDGRIRLCSCAAILVIYCLKIYIRKILTISR